MSGAVAVAGVVTMVEVPSAHATVSPGQGSSYAQSLQATPHDGALAVGVVLGEALAGHTNDIARAQSQGIDLGAIGTSLTSYNCGTQSFKPNQIPQALQTETGQPGADQGQTQTLDPSQGANQPSYGTYEHVQATAAPYGEADTAFAPLNLAGITVAGMYSKAWSGIVGGQRVAAATSDVGQLDIAGVVQLKGMHWQSQYPSGGAGRPSGSFTLGSLEVHGVPVPVNQSPDALTKVINTALGTVGLEMQLPVSSVQQGVQSVTPLQIEAVPNPTRDNIVNIPLNATESQQQQLFGGLENGVPGEPSALVTALCQSDNPITVAEIAIASVNGGGYLSIGLGGVNSSSSDVAANPYQLSEFSGLGGGTSLGTGSGSDGSSGSVPGSTAALSTAPSGSVAVPTGSSGPALPSTGSSPVAAAGPAPSVATGPAGGSASAGAAAPTYPPAAQQAVLSPAAASYAAGGPLLGIGLGGLALLALLAEGDRRMMRRAQHTVHFEE